ncbi:MAG: hypothetical protein LUG85_08490 [Clostridiales bacterium]|nr:hypothetical protein [Clostridiales bacterium]
MIESLTEYWYMWLVLVVLIGITVFAMKKASAAVKKHNAVIRQQEEEMKRYKFLLDKYSDITAEAASECDGAELTEGVTAVLQRQIEKAVHLNEEFENAEEWRRIVYSLYYFAEDTETSLSFFFKNNGEPIPSLAVKGIKAIGAENEKKLITVVSSQYAMFDEKNETVSVDRDKIAELDDKFNEIFDKSRFFESVKQYIISNLS